MGIVVLRTNKNFLDKVILDIISMRMKGCLTLDVKGRISIVDLLDLGMVRIMRVGVWLVGMVVMEVVKVAT